MLLSTIIPIINSNFLLFLCNKGEGSVLEYLTPISIVWPVNRVNVNQAARDNLSADHQTKVLEIAADDVGQIGVPHENH
jgi:hypothetical protein